MKMATAPFEKSTRRIAVGEDHPDRDAGNEQAGAEAECQLADNHAVRGQSDHNEHGGDGTDDQPDGASES